MVIETKGLSGGNITFKTAAEAAAPLVSEMLKPIYGQIDPLKLGENARLLKIANEYLDRIDEHSKNLKTESDVLVSAYPDHGFVIDRKEAKRLFKNVAELDQDLFDLCDALGTLVLYPPTDRAILVFVDQLELKEEGETDGKERSSNDDRAEADQKTDGSVQVDGIPNDGRVSPDGGSGASLAAVEPWQAK